MSLQSQVNTTMALAGGLGAGIAKASGKGMYAKKDNSEAPSIKAEPSAKDIEMAKKARRETQDKINAIIMNREISAKARTRRIGKVLDEYKGGSKDGK